MTINRNSSRSWLTIGIFLSRSIWPLEVRRVKDFGHREPNATLDRRLGGGTRTLECSADRADGETGRRLLSYLDGGQVSLHGAYDKGDLIEWPVPHSRLVTIGEFWIAVYYVARFSKHLG